ncbi:GNAT family N-acetyltransferase [Aquimarina gracilis]|uniref:GNAT family N-acetyltransferase n=1 Tax=Aquimarina gracilis TaxID=874422 RepID=A0ABU5ZXL5_9FLAO|nr:GNAT family N-acetyltransferase [Aquimarina gracilis]MEB3346619.1 GNAT family N-acetyltransferase [Aquimarina gracilis]
MYSIQLIPKEKLEIILPFLKLLSPKRSIKTLHERLIEMISEKYECVGVYDQDKLIGISGMWFLTKYYIGKHIEPDNVFILPEYQGKGVGKLLMNWIFEYAKSKGCKASELNCYINNKKGQKFWENQGYELIAYHYQKKI